MGQVIINYPDPDGQRFLDALAHDLGYDPNETSLTKQQFVELGLAELLKRKIHRAEAELAGTQARETALANPAPDITVTL